MTDLMYRKLKETIFVNTLRATKNPQNLLEDGTPNWNFVDAEAYEDTITDTRYDRVDVENNFYTIFDGVCDRLGEILNLKETV